MAPELIAHLILSATIISCGGWVWETLYCSAVSRHLVRRGMLYGPSCPIYGVSAIVVWLMLGWIEDALILFVLGCLLSTVLEYTAGTLLESRFGRRWWDYTMFPGNFRGLVCPEASCVFGLFALIDVKILQPAILGGLAAQDQRLVAASAIVCSLAYALDLLATVCTLDETSPRDLAADRALRLRKLISR